MSIWIKGYLLTWCCRYYFSRFTCNSSMCNTTVVLRVVLIVEWHQSTICTIEYTRCGSVTFIRQMSVRRPEIIKRDGQEQRAGHGLVWSVIIHRIYSRLVVHESRVDEQNDCHRDTWRLTAWWADTLGCRSSSSYAEADDSMRGGDRSMSPRITPKL